MTEKQSPNASPALALDREIALSYVTWLVESRGADDAEARRRFCEARAERGNVDRLRGGDHLAHVISPAGGSRSG